MRGTNFTTIMIQPVSYLKKGRGRAIIVLLALNKEIIMYYQFNAQGECVSSCTGAIEPMQDIISVWCDAEYSDLQNIKLINSEVYHLEKDDANGTAISS